jgi:hypothetical protein
MWLSKKKKVNLLPREKEILWETQTCLYAKRDKLNHSIFHDLWGAEYLKNGLFKIQAGPHLCIYLSRKLIDTLEPIIIAEAVVKGLFAHQGCFDCGDYKPFVILVKEHMIHASHENYLHGAASFLDLRIKGEYGSEWGAHDCRNTVGYPGGVGLG